jgi:hypothetical protein
LCGQAVFAVLFSRRSTSNPHAGNSPGEVHHCFPLTSPPTANRVPGISAKREGRSMTPRFAMLVVFLAYAAFGQSVPPDGSLPDQPPAEQQVKQDHATQNKPPNEAQRSTALEVEPGPPVIKQKDLWEGTGI